MITSEKQLNVTKKRIEELKASLNVAQNKAMNPALQKAARIQMETLIQELEDQVSEYDLLRSEGVTAIKVRNASDWLLLPVRFRIAKNMSQDAFSVLVGVSTRQIARYEAEEYGNIQTETLKKILDRLPIVVSDIQISEKKIG